MAKDSAPNRQADTAVSDPPRSSMIGRWAVVTILAVLLIAAAILAYLGWISGGDTGVPASGYVAMALGVIFSLAIGIGLMALLFYSSRKGYDEPAVLVEDRDSDPHDDQKTS
jgi:hypothetical protein